MFTKWVITGIDGFRFAEDGKLYRVPFVDKAGKQRDWREIKEQNNNWKIKGVWYSKVQLKPRLEPDTKPIQIFKTKDLPF